MSTNTKKKRGTGAAAVIIVLCWRRWARWAM